jgi:hypothetical protein
MVVFIFVACKDPFFLSPIIPFDPNASRAGSPPDIVSASQGEKRAITLSWNEIPNAMLYYIYKAASPLDVFARCGETALNQVTFNVQPGSTIYYRVSSVAYDGKESQQSFYVRGTSLAQTVITDITEVTHSDSTVTWYMDNVSGDTYRNNLSYTVYCFNGTAIVAQQTLEASQLAENKAKFSGLGSETAYSYQVKAFLTDNPSMSEESDIMDRETAIRSRPGAPDNLKASQGTSVDSITLSFELPDPVKIKNGDQYNEHNLFFVISKRVYNENGSEEYTITCEYFGADDETSPHIINPSLPKFGNYEVGKTVTWTDPHVERELKYEYQVQAYVDGTDKKLSSDESKASAVGWILAEGELSYGRPIYTLNAEETLNISAKLSLHFILDTRGVDYRFKVLELIKPIGDGHEFDPEEEIMWESGLLTYADLGNYATTMDLTGPSTALSPGRGHYFYEVMICLPDETEVETINAIGFAVVSEFVDPITVDGFSVLDGFTNKFLITWMDDKPDQNYYLFESSDGKNWSERAAVSGISSDAEDEQAVLRSIDVEGYEPGTTKYFALQPAVKRNGSERKGDWVYHPESKTLGRPIISQGGDGHSYSVVTVLWTRVQKADTYRVKYWYTDEGAHTAVIAGTLKASELSVDVNGRYKYTFTPFAGHVDVRKAGKEMQIVVEALNKGLQTELNCEEICTSSAKTVEIRLVGPALLGLSASKAASAEEIHVSWNRISGADGYYVFRRQFNMAGTAEEGTEAVVYYVPASVSSSIAVTGKNLVVESNVKNDTKMVKAAVSCDGSVYLLTDEYLADGDYDGIYKDHTQEYRNQQNNLIQGYPYRYFVVPVVNRGGAPESLYSIEFEYGKDFSNNNTDITSYAIRENGINLNYSGAANLEQEGFAIGFGQNVVATKGTYASSGNANSGIGITWTLPSRFSSADGFSPQFTVYRKKHDETSWTELQRTANLSYVDIPPDMGVVYEYTVGISNGNNNVAPLQPQDFPRYIEACKMQSDDKGRPDMLGFMLTRVIMESASRDQRTDEGGNFAELVQWYSAGIENPFNEDPNWGIDGYMLLVMNRSINGNWHEIVEIEMTDDTLEQTNYSAMLNNSTGLLKVLRDYKHYYKVCAYVVMQNGDKMYGPEHSTVWSESFNTDDNPYLKWGARQISVNEFAAITSLSIATGMNRRSDYNVNISSGVSRTINFNNSRPPHMVTITGIINAYSQLNKKAPSHYGATASSSLIPALGAKNSLSTLTITGPAGLGMYSGTVKIENLKSDSGTGPYKVSYNGQNDVSIESKHYLECFTFYPTGIIDVVLSDPDYKPTDDMDWNPDTGW